MADDSPRSSEIPTPNDYAAAAGTLRSMCSEMTFVMAGVELPGGFAIVERHVDARGKKIDFALRGARGRKAKLEVKAWSQRAWARELVNLVSVDPASAAGHMIHQLRAARAAGVPVYLAVLDVIGDRIAELRRLLDYHKLDEVEIMTFPESQFERTFQMLRAGLRIPAFVTPALADSLAEVDDD